MIRICISHIWSRAFVFYTYSFCSILLRFDLSLFRRHDKLINRFRNTLITISQRAVLRMRFVHWFPILLSYYQLSPNSWSWRYQYWRRVFFMQTYKAFVVSDNLFVSLSKFIGINSRYKLIEFNNFMRCKDELLDC